MEVGWVMARKEKQVIEWARWSRNETIERIHRLLVSTDENRDSWNNIRINERIFLSLRRNNERIAREYSSRNEGERWGTNLSTEWRRVNEQLIPAGWITSRGTRLGSQNAGMGCECTTIRFAGKYKKGPRERRICSEANIRLTEGQARSAMLVRTRRMLVAHANAMSHDNKKE